MFNKKYPIVLLSWHSFCVALVFVYRIRITLLPPLFQVSILYTSEVPCSSHFCLRPGSTRPTRLALNLVFVSLSRQVFSFLSVPFICVCVHMRVPRYICWGQRTAWRVGFSPSTRWWSSGSRLVASPIPWAIDLTSPSVLLDTQNLHLHQALL